MTKPMNITEKILADHAGLNEVKAGQLITAKVDITLVYAVGGLGIGQGWDHDGRRHGDDRCDDG